MADTNVITYYEVQRHIVGTTLWVGNWYERSLDRTDADANAQKAREFADADHIDAVRVAEVAVETVEPLVSVVVEAEDAGIYLKAEAGVVDKLAENGFVFVDRFSHHGSDHDRFGGTLTFVKAKEQ